MTNNEQPFNITDLQAARLLQKHGFDASQMAPSKFLGEANYVWLTPDVAIRICTLAEYELDACNERIFVPVARELGMPCPKLLVFDDERDIVPTLATIYQRVDGVPFGAFELSAEQLKPIAIQLAELLNQLHCSARRNDAPLGDPTPEFQPVLETARQYLTTGEHAWVSQWAQELLQLKPATIQRFLHGDIHSMNILVDDGHNPQRITALMDWTDCAWGDVALEFAMLPPHFMPLFVNAYRQVSEMEDEEFEGRVMGFMLESVLYCLRIPETVFPLWYRGRSTWDSMLRLFAEEAAPNWTRWFPTGV